MPALHLDAPCSFIDAAGDFLLAISARGRLHIWNVAKGSACLQPASMLELLTPMPGRLSPSIKSAKVRPNGAPVLTLTDGRIFSYDSAIMSWTTLSSIWWSKGSDQWESRTRGKAVAAGARGAVKAIESSVNDIIVDRLHHFDGDNDVDMDDENTISPEGEEQQKLGHESDWKAAMTLGHLEARLAACITLDSPAEYRVHLIAYATRIGVENYRSKAEELIRSLMGPIYL